jgi:hypothetical protein
MGGVDPVLEEILQGAGEREESLVAVLSLGGAVVHAVAEFDVRIQRPSRLSPAEGDVAA